MDHTFRWKNQISSHSLPTSNSPYFPIFSDDLRETTAVKALLDCNYSQDVIMKAVEDYVTTKGNTEFTAGDLLKIIINRQYDTSQASLPRQYDTSQASLPDPVSRHNTSYRTPVLQPCIEPDGLWDEETDCILQENREIEDSKRCKICLENNVNIVFLPCGHICACSECSPALRKCAICRQFIKHTAKVEVF